MNDKINIIGEGLDALLSLGGKGVKYKGEFLRSNVKQVSLSSIQPNPKQPRLINEPGELDGLVLSIKQHGLLQPLLVRNFEESIQIIAGERRWRAAKLAGLKTVPVIVKEVNDQEALAIALIENIQRKNLNPLEEAMAFQRLYTEFQLSHEAIAQAVGRSRAAVTNLLRLLILTDSVKEHLGADRISMGHARALITLDDDLQEKLCNEILIRQLSVRETEALARKWLTQPPTATAVPVKQDPDPRLQAWSRALEQRYQQANVSIQKSVKGSCRVTIKLDSEAALEDFVTQLIAKSTD